MTMKYSEAGYKLTKEFEGLRLMAYQDGGGVWTIGYGHTMGVKKGDLITEGQAQRFLEFDVMDSVDAVNKLVKVQLTQNEFDALVDFVFNMGEPQFTTSTLLRKLNSGDFKGAADQFKRWNLDNGKIEKGLVRRRKAEEDLFLSAV